MIIEWEPKSVSVGMGILIVMLIVCYFIQRSIDAGYSVKRKEVEASIADQEARTKAAEEAAKAANPKAYKALKELKESATELMNALNNPAAAPERKPSATPTTAPMQV